MSSKITDRELVKLIREVAEIVNTGTESTAISQAQKLKNVGIKANMNVDLGRELTPRETLEWYAGSFVDIVEEGAWFAMNTWLNCVDKFAHITE
jgi:hypothetical protein